MQAIQEVSARAAVLADTSMSRLADLAANRQSVTDSRTVFRWVWVVFIGVIIVAAAVAFVYCRARGYRGFSGHIEAVRGPWGIRIGTRLGCY